MARNTNVRCIRVSEEMDELINQQIGDTYTAKFTNLVTRCVWELPAKEAELEHIEKLIQDKKEELEELYRSARSWRKSMQAINTRLTNLETTLTQELRSWEIDV